jgi:hypothetical protein
VQDQPAGGVSGDEGVELPGELAPDPELRAARNELRAVSASIREALAADDRLAAGQPAGNDADGTAR